MLRPLGMVPVALLMAAGALAEQRAPPPAPVEADAIALESHLVLLNVAVTDPYGRYTRGLRREAFQVLDQGEPQPITEFGAEETPFAAAILLDASGSQERMLRIGRAAARQFADGLRSEDLYAVYVFAGKVAKVQDFGNSADLDEVIWSIRPDGNTALYDALAQATLDLGERPEKRRAILLLSDGDDTASRLTHDAILRDALDRGVTIYAVDLLDEQTPAGRLPMARAALRDLTARTGGRYVADQGGALMHRAFKEIVGELSHQYTLGFTPKSARHDGKWHKLEVRLTSATAEARTRQGYFAPKRH